MSKPSFFTESLGRRSLSIAVVSVLTLMIAVSAVATSQENGAGDRREAFRRLVQSYVQTGKVEYEKRYFAEAEKTFLMAKPYQEYLTPAEREQLETLLKDARTATAERKRALETFPTVNGLIKQDKLSDAKKRLEGLKSSAFLTEYEQAQIAEVLRQLSVQMTDDEAHSEKVEEIKLRASEKLEKIAEGIRKPSERLGQANQKIYEIYLRSMECMRAGQLEKARPGFVKVATSGLIPPLMKKTVEGHIAKIDSLLPQKITAQPELVATVEPKVVEPTALDLKLSEPRLQASESAESADTEPAAAEPKKAAPKDTAPVAGEGSYIERMNKKRNIIRTYTATVVNDADVKARAHMGKGNFEKAKQAVALAASVVNENQIHLGEELFKAHSIRLRALNDEIGAKEAETAQLAAQQKREAAAADQRKFREQMEVDRQKRISQLLENAKAYQKQQRYEAALGQLTSLLALDPQHDEALMLKDMLEDTVFFRRQLEVEKESSKANAEQLIKNDISQIPHAEEIIYPKNWREIIEKPTRKPDEPIGLDPIDAEVYQRMEQIVDLSNLNAGMSFDEVVNELENAVDPPLQIQPNWKDLLEIADIEPTTPAMMDPLTGIKLRKALEVLVAGVSSEFAVVDYVVDEGVIVIATEEALPAKMVTRVYDITDLVGEPAQYGGMQGMMMGRMVGMMGGGGGMMGGMGGMGGGMMGGMGGMGGGMMGGMGGMGGGMMGGMGGGMGGMMQAQSLVQLIQESIDPESWFELNDLADGTVTPYPIQQPKKLAVFNTHEVHEEVEKLLTALRKALGHQVSIEARFLVVSESFLEDIGLDVDFSINGGSHWGQIGFEQDSAFITNTEPTSVPLSLGGIGASASLGGGYGTILDDLQVSFLLRATQAHRDAKSLSAPVATVLSGESASFNNQRQLIFALPPIQQGGATQLSGVGGTTTNVGQGQTPQYLPISTGSVLSITPIITHDKKNVLLNILTVQNDFLGVKPSKVEVPVVGGVQGAQVLEYDVQLPETENSTMMTRVSVPDSGTLLLGGQRITSEVETEAGVPILSKIPVIGRLFSNRSKVKDSKILLILVKPVIILQEEREAEAIAAMEGL